jgi:ParB-like chromosome segregation protein Spo0J
MKYVIKQLKELKSFENNPRVFTGFMMDKLKLSITTFGLVEPLVINGSNEVLGGNQRLVALIEICGLDYATDCVLVDYLSKSKERALNIALNKIEGLWDVSLLKDMILSIDKNDLTYLGFTEQELTLFVDSSINNDELPNTSENFNYDVLIHCISEKQRDELKDWLTKKEISYK